MNGSMGAVHDISWEDGQDPSTLPSIILIKFDEYNGPDFVHCTPGVIPVFPATRHFEYKGVACSRTQFPLRLAYAITVHKSQGLTLSRAVLNLNQREHCLGLSYVAVSRVKTLARVLFKVPFDFDRFMTVNSVVLIDRELDHIARTTQLL